MQRFPAEAEFFQRAGTEVLDEDIGRRGKAFDDLEALRRLHIDGDGLLVARLEIPPDRGAFVDMAPGAQGIALPGRFDLNDLSAEFAEEARGEGGSDERAHFKDTNAG